MRRIGLKVSSTLAAVLLAILAMALPSHSVAQMTESQQGQSTGSIHGHVNNPVGQPITKGEVRLTTDKSAPAAERKYQYKFPLDANGDYKGANIAPGNYVVFVFQDEKSLDYIDGVIFTSGADKTVNFDMSRPDYIKALPPDEQKQIEEYKKKNAEVSASNAKIQNLNAMLTQARTDNKAGNYDAAIAAMQQATTAKPDEGILWITLGDAQLGAADAAAKAAKAAGTAPTDPAIVAKYNDAAVSYKKGVDLNAASKKPSPEAAAAGYNQLGQVYAKQGNTKDAADAYEQAAKALPANAGMYYFNEAATLYNSGKLPEAEAAADKAIAADPKKAESYYIKGQSLISQAKVDEKTKKIVAPPGTAEAYQMYLELAPDGPHAADVKGILEGIGAPVKSTYKAPKK
ncbi:MAG TPA: tetratricopeptide repeat protein [Edaphobacter sp.]|jgi:tetratricopeptide (TPR) repeat protein|nr:tetratricopeptide repeat protein [Edaphobacter sp.]